MSNARLDADQTQAQETLKVLDTTLRDGEQAPGFSMTPAQKMEMAHLLERLRVDVIEAGFAAASPGDHAAIRAIAEAVETTAVCSLARATVRDIDAAASALEPARKSRVHILLATSPIHREAKLKMTRLQVLETLTKALTHARALFDEVEFSAEDGLRTEPDFLVEALNCAAEAGADVLSIPDTVGFSEPGEVEALYRRLSAEVKRSAHVILSAHCHNDLGLAVSNTLAAVKGGARQIECTINGIGERAGNCSLEEAVMALKVRADLFPVTTRIDTTQLWPTSQRLSRLTGAALAPNKAVVGKNAFAHEAGIHQHGMLADRRTYEIMTPQSVGAPGSKLVLGKHSGKHALTQRLTALGYSVEGADLDRVFEGFKTLADVQGDVSDSDLLALLNTSDALGQWSVTRLELRSTLGPKPQHYARLELEHPERGRLSDIARGDDAMSAVFHAAERLLGQSFTVTSLDTRMVSHGESPMVLAELDLELEGVRHSGRARGPDALSAALKALLATLSRTQPPPTTTPTPTHHERSPAMAG
ncbi:2-isopropylmalate synthase [Woodsholea maritima]|uniref:2-isopropylmalate synthase n=1 Tax=Woodsholea maritima TaxID=240237 RepID=UPI00037512AA|nr:2-isopropylmalate synthase [Woodsholea maritima]